MPGFSLKPGDTVTVLPSTTFSTTGDQVSDDCWLPKGARAIRLIVQVTGVPTGSISDVFLAQRVGSDAGGAPSYVKVADFSALAFAAAGIKTFIVGPGYAQGGDSAAPVQVGPPSEFRVGVTTANNNPITASIRVNPIGE